VRLPSALGLAHAQQPARQVDVVPVESEQLAAAQAAVGRHRQQQPVPFGLAVEVPLPQLGASRLGEQPLQFAHGQHVGKRLALLRCAQRQRRIAQQPLLLDEEAEETLQRRRRARLARDRRAPLLFAREEGAQVRHLHLPELHDPITLQVHQTRQNVTLVGRASHRGKPPLRAAKAQEIGHFRTDQRVHLSSFKQPPGPRWGEL
jgi:hypothetical protein